MSNSCGANVAQKNNKNALESLLRHFSAPLPEDVLSSLLADNRMETLWKTGRFEPGPGHEKSSSLWELLFSYLEPISLRGMSSAEETYGDYHCGYEKVENNAEEQIYQARLD